MSKFTRKLGTPIIIVVMISFVAFLSFAAFKQYRASKQVPKCDNIKVLERLHWATVSLNEEVMNDKLSKYNYEKTTLSVTSITNSVELGHDAYMDTRICNAKLHLTATSKSGSYSLQKTLKYEISSSSSAEFEFYVSPSYSILGRE